IVCQFSIRFVSVKELFGHASAVASHHCSSLGIVHEISNGLGNIRTIFTATVHSSSIGIQQSTVFCRFLGIDNWQSSSSIVTNLREAAAGRTYNYWIDGNSGILQFTNHCWILQLPLKPRFVADLLCAGLYIVTLWHVGMHGKI